MTRTIHSLSHRSIAALALVCVALACGAACSSDADEPTADAGTDAAGEGSGAEPTGPTDDATAVEVTVPAAPRAFVMGVGVPAEGLGTVPVDTAWNRVDGRADLIAIWLDNGLPWQELLAGEPLPAEVDAWLTDIGNRANGLGVDVVVVIDWLSPDRSGLGRDVLGRELPGVDIGDPRLRTALASYAREVASRFARPAYFVPVVDVNLVAGADSARFDELLEIYRGMRDAAQDAGAGLVFPLWDVDDLRNTWQTQDETGMSRLTRFDERLDRFAISFVPSRSFTGVASLADDELDFLSELSTRPLAIVGASYPAEGFVTGGEAFASSENSQHNFFAWVAAASDRLSVDLVVWRLLVDPNDILRDPCGGALPGCDVDDVTRRFAPYASSGLLDNDAAARPAMELWRNYLARPHN